MPRIQKAIIIRQQHTRFVMWRQTVSMKCTIWCPPFICVMSHWISTWVSSVNDALFAFRKVCNVYGFVDRNFPSFVCIFDFVVNVRLVRGWCVPDCVKDPAIVARFRSFCLCAMGQRTPIACFEKSTDKVVGANMVTVYSQADNMAEQFKRFVSGMLMDTCCDV